jgi:hypothetical protein
MLDIMGQLKMLIILDPTKSSYYRNAGFQQEKMCKQKKAMEMERNADSPLAWSAMAVIQLFWKCLLVVVDRIPVSAEYSE